MQKRQPLLMPPVLRIRRHRNEKDDAFDSREGLAGAGAGDDQERAGGGVDGLALIGVGGGKTSGVFDCFMTLDQI